MKLGLFAINYGTCADPEVAIEVARHAEACGFESVWSGEHLVLPDPPEDGLPFPPTHPLLEALVALTNVAAHTDELRVATGVIVLPLRNPVVLAKELAALDVCSGGRLTVGVGAGYIGAAFEAIGVPLGERGRRTDEGIGAMRALWTMERPSYRGRHVRFAGVDAQPRPLQRPAPPIVVGGHSPRALRRAVTLAEGWYGFGLDRDAAGAAIASLRETARREDRPAELGRLEITVTPPGSLDRDGVERYAELGVDRLVFLPGQGPESLYEPVAREEILAHVEHLGGTADRLRAD